MSTPDPGAVLRTLHRIHIQLGDLRERLDRGPKQIKAREALVAKQEADLAQIRAEQKAARVAVDQKQLLLKSGESKIKDLHAKLMAAQSNREYQALKDQIAADEMANSVFSDEILEALERLDAFKASITEVDQAIAKTKDELAKVREQIRQQNELLLADVQRLEAELREVEPQLPADFRDPYLRLSKSKGPEAMAVVEGEHCSGCYQLITANMANALAIGRFVPCNTCGRILYLPEDRSPARKR